MVDLIPILRTKINSIPCNREQSPLGIRICLVIKPNRKLSEKAISERGARMIATRPVVVKNPERMPGNT